MLSNDDLLANAFRTGLALSEGADVTHLEYRSIPQWDSVAHMQLIMELENLFEVMLQTDDVINLSSYTAAKNILGKYGVRFSS